MKKNEIQTMKLSAKEIAEKLRNALRENISEFEGLYLFGSQAKGTATEESDIDIVVLMSKWDWRDDDDFYNLISEFTYKYDADLDLHPMTRSDLERNPVFYNEVVNKGVFYAIQ